MPRRFLACFLALVAVAIAQQVLSVQQVIEFVHSQIGLTKQKRSTDAVTAKFLDGVKLSEKLDISVIENLQADGAGPLTVKVLQKLQQQSKSLREVTIQQTLPDVPRPIPTSEEQGRILDEVRQYVDNYDKSLPNFMCVEYEQRLIAPKRVTHPGGEPSYTEQDNITSRITYFNHEEKKAPILHGSRPVNGDYRSLGGAQSEGDFENMLRSLFDPNTQARFEWERWATLRGRSTMVFSFKVARERSSYKLGVPDEKREIITAYSGLVYVDEAPPHAVTKLVTRAEDVPVDFPIQKAETILDYQFTDIGGTDFLLPYNETVAMENVGSLSKNTNTFKYYQKYEVGSAINYDIPAGMSAASDADLKETPAKPAADCKDPKNKDLPQCKK